MNEFDHECSYNARVEITKKSENRNYRAGARAILTIIEQADLIARLEHSRDIAADHAESYIRQLAEARRRANYDSLTNLGNSDKFNSDAARLEQRVNIDSQSRMGLMLLDVDGLKRLNDDPNGGHEAGNVLLKALAETLENSLRYNDTAYRLRGDEFAVLMPINKLSGDVTDFTSGIERRFQEILEHSIANQGFPEGLYLGVSVGCGVLGHFEEMSSLMRRVEGYVYANKEERRELLRSQGVTFQDSRLLAN